MSVSGAVAERCELTAYFAYSVVISSLVYPVAVHWAWTPGGWLAINVYYDFASLGAFILMVGSFSFNGATNGATEEDRNIVQRSVINTIIFLGSPRPVPCVQCHACQLDYCLRGSR